MLSHADRERARKTLLRFGFFNALSFTLLTGNLVSLYLLRLGAGNALIGIVASFSYVAFFFLVVGKQLVPAVGVIRMFAWAWLIRYIAVLPMLFAPVFIAAGRTTVSFFLVAAGAFGFHAARGVGIVANAPMFSGFAGGADRGRLLSQFQMLASVMSIVAGSAVAFLLGPEASLGRYVLFLGAGVAAGLIATGLVFSLPELEDERQSAREPLFPTLKRAAENPAFRNFVTAFLLVAIASGVGRSFLVVFAKQAYDFTDRAAFMMVAVGSVGNFVAGLLGSILLDRLGAKPIILFSLTAYAISLIPAVVLPQTGEIATFIMMGAVFSFATLGFSGAENANQAYFYGITQRDARFNLGIVYFIALGLGGVIGSFAGGLFLDLASTLVGEVWSFRALFFVTIAIIATALFRAWKLEPLGAETFRGALEVIFSPRDLRAANLLNRLVRSRSQDEERRAIRDLASSGSSLALADLRGRLASPSYAVRQETLEALSSLPYTREVEESLIEHLAVGRHTTASMAARLLGLRGSGAAIPALEGVLTSDDRVLAGRALVALARLASTTVDGEVRRILTFEPGVSTNPSDLFTAVLHAAVALQIAGSRDHLPVLWSALARDDLPGYVLDELVFAASRILEMYDWLYPLYASFVRNDAVKQDRLEHHLVSATPDRLAHAIRLVDRSHDGKAAQRSLVEYLGEPAVVARRGAARPTLEEVGRLSGRGRTVFFAAAVLFFEWLRDRTTDAPTEEGS